MTGVEIWVYGYDFETKRQSSQGLAKSFPETPKSTQISRYLYLLSEVSTSGSGQLTGIATRYGPQIESRLVRGFPHQSRPALRLTRCTRSFPRG